MSAIKAIHVGLRQLGIQSEDQRDFYEAATGKRSLREMSPKEHETIVAKLREKGFSSAPRSPRKAASKMQGPYAKKLQALWIGAWNLGIVRSRSDDALLAFIKRQTGIDHTRFLRYAEDGNKAIEALKAWMVREANVYWPVEKIMSPYQTTAGYKIAVAQWYLLPKDHPHKKRYHFNSFVGTYAQSDNILSFKEADWIPVMNKLGFAIRELAK